MFFSDRIDNLINDFKAVGSYNQFSIAYVQ